MWNRSTATFSHEVLWRASQSALRTASTEHPHVRPDHLAIQSLLCGFLAFEGFVNLVGEEVAPATWVDERSFFSKGTFRGIEGKVQYLFTRFPGSQLKKGEEPYKTFRTLKRVRDDLAHNRVLRVDEVTLDEDPGFTTKWDEFDSPARVDQDLKRLKEFAEMIRLEALKILKDEYELSHLHFPAFEGPLGDSTGFRGTR
jgi:hypothetical protein